MAEDPEQNSKRAKKKMPLSFIIALNALIGFTLVGFLGWYFLTAGLSISGSKQTAEGMIAEQVVNAKDAIKKHLEERARSEGFDLDNVDGCVQIQDQYRVPMGFVFSEFSLRQLVGLPNTATDEQVRERCIVFAKAVERMETMSHHDRHAFVCQGAQFATDEVGQYMLVPDPEGRGVIEILNGVRTLIEIVQFSHTLVGQWQVLNLGDGCVVVGMSKVGVFSFSGAVKFSGEVKQAP